MDLINRRQMLTTAGAAAGACVLACNGDIQAKIATSKNKLSKEAWVYSKLNPDRLAEQAYNNYSKGHCMYGVFASVIMELGDKFGEPYSSFPVDMMVYGAGGAGGWGSLCGALNGGAALIGLFVRDATQQKQVIGKLFKWYETTQLPAFEPSKPSVEMKMPVSVSNSVLCHVSVTNWCKASGEKAFTKEQKERCNRLTADVIRKTVELLNEHIADPHAVLTTPVKPKGCAACHTAKGSTMQNSRGKMSCNSCHSMPDKHPKDNTAVSAL